MSAETIASPDGGRKTGARLSRTRNRRRKENRTIGGGWSGSRTAILRADLDHDFVGRPCNSKDIEQDPILLVLGVRSEADCVERQDLSALQERAPAGNQCGLRDVDLLERVRIRSAADESRQLGERAQAVQAT
jgi:hypothetical protein